MNAWMVFRFLFWKKLADFLQVVAFLSNRTGVAMTHYDRMYNRYSGIKYGLYTLFSYLVFQELFRIIFFATYRPENPDTGKFIISLFRGLRFDVSIYTLLMLPHYLFLIFPLISHLLPGKLEQRVRLFHNPENRSRLFQLHLFYPGFIVLISTVLHFVDMGYYDSAAKRMTFEPYLPRKDLLSTISLESILFQYNTELLLAIVFVLSNWLLLYFLWQGFRRKACCFDHPKARRPLSSVTSIAVFFAFLFVAPVAIRGGFQLKPINITYAFDGTPSVYGYTAMNTVFSITKGARIATTAMDIDDYISKENCLELQSFLGRNNISPERCRNIFFIQNTQSENRQADPFDEKTDPTARNKPNVVLIIMESFNAEEIGSLNPNASRFYSEGERHAGLAPHFDRLASEGLLFTRFYATARRSVEAFPSIISSLPDFTEHPLVWSAFASIKTAGLAAVFNNSGYSTHFYHGAENGSMNLDQYTKISGFQHYHGMEEYLESNGDKNNYDGAWGIYDHAFFDFMYNDLKDENQPFFAVFYSLSNHLPCHVPEKFADEKNLFNKGSLAGQGNPDRCQKAFLYSDASLGEFISRARTQNSAFKDAVFVITSDHYTFFQNRSYQTDRSLFNMYHIPFLIHWPNRVPPGTRNYPGDHTDILPTLVDLLDLDVSYASTGQSLLKDSENHHVYIEDSGIHILIKDKFAVTNNFRGVDSSLMRKGKHWLRADKENNGLNEVERILLQKEAEDLQHYLKLMYSYMHNAVSNNQFVPAHRK